MIAFPLIHEKLRAQRDSLQRTILLDLAMVTAGFLMVVAAVILSVKGLSLN
jgi:hypothetical protein